MNKIGTNIKLSRESKNISQDDLAQKLSVSSQTVSDYEKGKANPDIEMIKQIADVLQTDANKLIYGYEEAIDKKVKIRNIIQIIICLVLFVVMHYLDKYLDNLFDIYFILNPRLLFDTAVWPFLYIFAGWSIMLFMQTLTGYKPLVKKYLTIIHWILIALILSFVVINLPLWIWLIQDTWAQISLMSRGGIYSYESSSPLSANLAFLLLFNFNIAKSFFLYIFIGAGLWLTKGKKKKLKNAKVRVVEDDGKNQEF